MSTAIYPGSFDPLTYGHIDIIKRAAKLFDHLIIGVALNVTKKPLFSPTERMQMIREIVGEELPDLQIDAFNCLLIDYAISMNAAAIIRGLRAVSDFEYEFQMALMNRHLSHQIETVFLMPSAQYSFISSNLVKEVASFGGNVEGLVPPLVKRRLEEHFSKPRK